MEESEEGDHSSRTQRNYCKRYAHIERNCWKKARDRADFVEADNENADCTEDDVDTNSSFFIFERTSK